MIISPRMQRSAGASAIPLISWAGTLKNGSVRPAREISAFLAREGSANGTADRSAGIFLDSPVNAASERVDGWTLSIDNGSSGSSFRSCHGIDPMPYAPEHKQQTRERIIGAAARLFNRRGFAEV